MRAVMSAANTGEQTEDGRITWSFAMPQAIPPYLFALAVGNLASQDLGPRSRVYTEPEMLEASAWGVPVITGPHVFNFASVSELLLQRQAARQVGGDAGGDRHVQEARSGLGAGERARELVERADARGGGGHVGAGDDAQGVDLLEGHLGEGIVIGLHRWRQRRPGGQLRRRDR